MASIRSFILAASPAVYYPLNEASGTTISDASGNNNNATLVGSVSYAVPGVPGDPSDGAMGLDGSTSYIALPATIDASSFTALSLYICFQFPSSPTHNGRLVANSHTDSDHKGFQVVVNSGAASGFVDIGNGSGEDFVGWNQSLALATWHDYVMTYDNHTLTAYIDGVAVNAGTLTGPIAASGFPINIGRNPAYNGDYAQANIAHFALFTSVLSADNAAAFHNAMLANYVSNAAFTARSGAATLVARDGNALLKGRTL